MQACVSRLHSPDVGLCHEAVYIGCVQPGSEPLGRHKFMIMNEWFILCKDERYLPGGFNVRLGRIFPKWLHPQFRLTSMMTGMTSLPLIETTNTL